MGSVGNNQQFIPAPLFFIVKYTYRGYFKVVEEVLGFLGPLVYGGKRYIYIILLVVLYF